MFDPSIDFENIKTSSFKDLVFTDKMKLAYDNFDHYGPKFLWEHCGRQCFL